MVESPPIALSRQQSSGTAWPPLARFAFRFAFLYWAIYLLPSPGAVSLLDLLPWLGDRVNIALGWPIHTLAPWVGAHIFYLRGEAANWHPTGSGDTAMNYVAVAIDLVIALAGAAVWSAVSELRGGKKEYVTAYAWLRLVIRFTLALTLLDYGFIKIFPVQFGPLGDYGLTETYGDSSPMHLLWTFMGQSRAYMFFGGLMEIIPGLLLMFRRTSTAGLLGALATLLNVVMLNFCYDVSVKLYSVHLLLMPLFLLLPDARPIWRFLLERKEASLHGVWVPRWERKPLRIGAYVLQGLIVVGALYSVITSARQDAHLRANVSPLRGVYAVDDATGFSRDTPWVQAYFDDRYGQHYLGLIGQDKKSTRFTVTYDLSGQMMHIIDDDSPATFHWNRNAVGGLALSGSFKGVPASMHLHKTSPDTFPLNTRGFHWVSEQSYNH